MKLTIKNRFTNVIIKEVEYDKTSNIDLREANLYGANLGEANLRGADLCEAKIKASQKDELLKALKIIVE